MHPTVKNFDELPLCLTVKDLQSALGISRPVAYELVNTKNFPSFRIGRVIRIPKDEFRRWLEEHAQK